MRISVLAVPALLLAGAAAAQVDGRTEVLDPESKAPMPQYRSAFEGYRSYAEPERANWRRSNDEVGAAGGHVGHMAGEGSGEQASKPQAGRPEASGAHHGADK